jgi:hypothetical protein
MKRSHITHLSFSTALLLALLLPAAAPAQNEFRLQRTKKESIPINVSLMAGYDGISEPAEILQDRFENTNLTSIGGVAFGLQGMIELDTILVRIWAGADLGYYRMMKRALYDDPGVHYIGEEGRVDAIESLWGIGANGFLAFGPVARMMLLLGGGLQYLDARLDKSIPVEGNLTEDQVVPVGFAALRLILFEYAHGSIDAQFRGLKGFGDYGSIHFQSMLSFTFAF